MARHFLYFIIFSLARHFLKGKCVDEKVNKTGTCIVGGNENDAATLENFGKFSKLNYHIAQVFHFKIIHPR